jgi:hypothetical protein
LSIWNFNGEIFVKAAQLVIDTTLHVLLPTFRQANIDRSGSFVALSYAASKVEGRSEDNGIILLHLRRDDNRPMFDYMTVMPVRYPVVSFAISNSSETLSSRDELTADDLELLIMQTKPTQLFSFSSNHVWKYVKPSLISSEQRFTIASPSPPVSQAVNQVTVTKQDVSTLSSIESKVHVEEKTTTNEANADAVHHAATSRSEIARISSSSSGSSSGTISRSDNETKFLTKLESLFKKHLRPSKGEDSKSCITCASLLTGLQNNSSQILENISQLSAAVTQQTNQNQQIVEKIHRKLAGSKSSADIDVAAHLESHGRDMHQYVTQPIFTAIESQFRQFVIPTVTNVMNTMLQQIQRELKHVVEQEIQTKLPSSQSLLSSHVSNQPEGMSKIEHDSTSATASAIAIATESNITALKEVQKNQQLILQSLNASYKIAPEALKQHSKDLQQLLDAQHKDLSKRLLNTEQSLKSIVDMLQSMNVNQTIAECARATSQNENAIRELSSHILSLPSSVEKSATTLAIHGTHTFSSATHSSKHDLQLQLEQLIAKGQVNEAFTIALNVRDPEFVVFICKRIDAGVWLSNNSSATRLHSYIVLSIVQQLSISLDVDTAFKLQFIQDAVLYLDTKDVIIEKHIPQVLQSVIQSIDKISVNLTPADRSACKILQRICRGTLSG